MKAPLEIDLAGLFASVSGGCRAGSRQCYFVSRSTGGS